MVTWDVDSRDSSLCARVRRFVYGYEIRNDGRTYRYPGFVEEDGVRYVGQSTLFVTRERLAILRQFLHAAGVGHVVMKGSVESIVHC